MSANRWIYVMVLLGAVCLWSLTQAQDRKDRTITCTSNNGRRTICEVNTTNGVRLLRQLSDSGCVEGSTWGYNERGIWVDRGCNAEFILGRERQPRDVNRPRMARIDAGTILAVRTNETIDVHRRDGRVYTGVLDEDVRGVNGEVAIPNGSNVELIVRVAPDNDLILDLESVMVNGQRYAIQADADRVEAQHRVGKDRRTGEFVGGGAVIGSIIGAIAGGGKGAAIGAAAGAAAGAGAVMTRGRAVRVPRETLVTFRIERPLDVGVSDYGIERDGRHYHLGR